MNKRTLPVYNGEGKEVDSVSLDAAVFDGSVNAATIYQAVNSYRANQRTGLACVKTRGEVSGGGRKPWRQKGTGRARVGSIRSPLWRHGGVVFGPQPRDFSIDLPAKIKKLALRSALNEKANENNIVVLDALSLASPKTKEAMRVFLNLKLLGKRGTKENQVLLLLDKMDENMKLALRNLGFLSFNYVKDTNTYEVMSHRKLVITRSALDELQKRLK